MSDELQPQQVPSPEPVIIHPVVPVRPGDDKKPLPISDCLALERTVMANERTLLAYIRTGLAVLVVAVTVIKLFSSQGMVILGYVLLVIGVACVTVGLMRFTETHSRLAELNKCNDNDRDTRR